MHQLRVATRVTPEPCLIIPLFTEADHNEWATQEFTTLCNLNTTNSVSHDISSLAQDTAWNSEEGPVAQTETVLQLEDVVQKIAQSVRVIAELLGRKTG
ncbi:unnamed protein product [Sphagnum balticum]